MYLVAVVVLSVLVVETPGVRGTGGTGQDATLTEGSYGTSVVNAVVDRIRSRCIFSEDRLFLRRVAHVMSRDGVDPATYRPGFHGGIWQVSQAAFSQTQNCHNSHIQQACMDIVTAFSIQWSTVQWSDLRKPLYSGLAAALSTKLDLKSGSMPAESAAQAAIWAKMYSREASVFVSLTSTLSEIDQCQDELDLAFLLDSSGSVSKSDFKLMLRFAADVVTVMNVSSDAVRVANIVYSSSARLAFNLNRYTNKQDVETGFLNTRKIGGGTSTDKALDMASLVLNQASYGARQSAKKVAILVTDGRSRSFSRTVSAAEKLKKLGTTVFAIGVGNYNPTELKAVASDPTCTHMLTLTSFSDIQSVLRAIQKSTCDANYQLTKGRTVEGTLTEQPSEKTAETRVPDSSLTIEAVVSCGILNIYVSATDPKPGPAVYDGRYLATPSVPAVLTFVTSLPAGSALYVTVVGTRLPPSVAAVQRCSDYGWRLGFAVKKNVSMTCQENGVVRPCTKSDVVRAGLCNQDDVDFPVENPCTQHHLDQGILRHRYLYDPTKFLQCDLKGQYYVTSCPQKSVFNAQSLECGFTSPSVTSTGSAQESNNGSPNSDPKNASTYVPVTPPPVASSNPCTPYNISKNLFYHTYQPDSTKYIQCDQWGKSWVRPCAPGTVWSQSHYTCIHKPTGSAQQGNTGSSTSDPMNASTLTSSTPPTVANGNSPCTPYNITRNIFYHTYQPDNTKFIQCDEWGQSWVRPCAPGTVWSQSHYTCIHKPTGSGQQSNTGSSTSDPKNASTLAPSTPPTVGNGSNPCTPYNISREIFYHTYQPDSTKFIQCNEWGQSWVRPCAPGTVWSQSHYTCIHKDKARRGARVNVPVVRCRVHGEILPDPCDHSQYYHCLADLTPVHRPCPPGLYFNPGLSVCDHVDYNTSGIPAYCP